jgi:hypothetical protein
MKQANCSIVTVLAVAALITISPEAKAQDCGWTYSNVVGSAGSNHYGYRREKKDYISSGEWGVACCPTVCTPATRPKINSGTLSKTATITKSRSRTRNYGGTLILGWNILNFSPFSQQDFTSDGDSATVTYSLGSSEVFCSQKLVAFEVTSTVERYERLTTTSGGTSKTETRDEKNYGSTKSFAAFLIGFYETINPCTMEVTGSKCPVQDCTVTTPAG